MDIADSVSSHKVLPVPIRESERESLMVAVQIANQFVWDNYREEHEKIAYISVCHYLILVPARTDIIGNLLIALQGTGVPTFMISLRSLVETEGMSMDECQGGMTGLVRRSMSIVTDQTS